MTTRFLIVRLDGLGDTVLTTPLLRAIRTHWPRSHITALVSPAGRACLVDHPGVDELIVFSPRDSTLRDKLMLGRRLRASGFHVALSATEKAWGYLWLTMSGAPRRIAFWSGGQKPVKSLLLARTMTDRVPESPTLHESERHLKLLEPLGMNGVAGPLWLSRAPGPAAGPFALHLSSKWVDDGWTDDWLCTLISRLGAQSPQGLLLTAGPGESEWARRVCNRIQALGGIDTLIDAPFDSWTLALSRCRLLVSMDTGAVHVGAALGLPVVDVFPARDAPRCVERWKPWMVPHVVVLRKSLRTANVGLPEEGSRVEQEILDATRKLSMS